MPRPGSRLQIAAALLAGALWVAAAPPPACPSELAALPPDEELERRGAVIGEIEIRVDNVFDPEQPGEDRMLYRLANRMHRKTRPRVIRQQLLVRPGDRYSARLLRESERLLRSRKYLYDCEIRPIRYRSNRVDLEVWVKDVWTLKLGLAVSRSGGENSTRFELQDTNLLGTGKAVTLERKDTVDRTSRIAAYRDRNFLGSRVVFEVEHSNNSDGDKSLLKLGRPFFSLDTRWAASLVALDDDRIDPLYRLGEIDREFRHREERLELGGGLSRGLVGNRARRFIFGVTYDASRFTPAADRPAPAALPVDRTLVYPWVGLSRVEDAFEIEHNQDQLSRTEDLFLGSRWEARLGLAAESFGSDRDRAVFSLAGEIGLRPGARQTLLLGAEAGGRWSGAGSENVIFAGAARYYWRNIREHLFFATIEAAAVRDLDAENQLLLGGDSGLRGYPLRYQDGDRRFLLTLEQRFFTGWYPFRLFYVGAAVFFDVGRTWAHDEALSPNQGWLRDVGVGLRFGSSRSGLGSVVHFDLAFPLDGDSSIESVQWLVTTKETL